MNECKAVLDIEIYPDGDKGEWAQAKYLVHGWDDVLWTDDLDVAISYLKQDAERLLTEKASEGKK